MTTNKTMSTNPIVLELAPLPREQVGPFLLLGLEKTAGKEQIEESWARRIIWARKNQIKVPLEDINWAREVLNDRDRRIRSDASSLNLDTTDGVLRDLVQRYGGDLASAHCKPLDVEKNLANFSPAVEMPDIEAVRGAIVVPDVPEEIPAVRGILEKFLQEPLDPWNLPLAPAPPP
jgi:hypothetical protein